MSTLQDKRIILGITGSIAAYKSATLARLLIKAGAEVQVLMTEAATEFISPLTLSTLTRRSVPTSVSSEDAWNNHVELGLWADLMIVAPLSANTLAKLALGMADNIVAAVYLSARCPVWFAPAMDLDMWHHPAVQANVQRLQSYGHRLIAPGYGELASGLVGEGRMEEPEAITALALQFFARAHDLSGKRILLTAGPTYEPIDPVRFIGNHSSGQMGIAIAEAAAQRGAKVHLVLGPSKLKPTHPAVHVHPVQTAQQMYEAAMQYFPDTDAAILAAAVADYRPSEPAPEKIKKTDEAITLRLIKNPDIAAALGQQKQSHQRIIGFALETENEEANARNKMLRKNMDAIVLNSLRHQGAGFDSPTNRIAILFPNNNTRYFELKRKTDVAHDILDVLAQWWNQSSNSSL